VIAEVYWEYGELEAWQLSALSRKANLPGKVFLRTVLASSEKYHTPSFRLSLMIYCSNQNLRPTECAASEFAKPPQ
jgi:hypothetical protein